jgi:hypothetical protein
MTLRLSTLFLVAGLLFQVPASTRAAAADVQTLRVPGGGVQPQAAAGEGGVVHLIYLIGDPAKSDVMYVRSSDGGATWSAPVRVNSQPGSAIATGTVRGAHLALGKGGRVHVAWMGSGVAEPKALGKESPMLYARLADDGKTFEPQRNVITRRVGLDGGGSIAADDGGNVYVAWHAPTSKGAGEAARRVWVSRSTDDGKTFAPETAMSSDSTGACGCCGMRIAVAGGRLYALYRSATEAVHRDIYLLASDAAKSGATAEPDAPGAVATKVGPMNVGACIMSTAAFGQGAGKLVAAWEREGQIEFAAIDPKTGAIGRATPVPGPAGNRKHPAVAINGKGETLVAWTEDTAWNKGGSVAWQVFGRDGKPVAGVGGRKAGLPAWGAPAAFTRADGSFVVMY